MKKVILILGIFISVIYSVNAQKTIKGNGNLASETRKTSSYDEIKLVGSTKIEIIDGKEGELTITGDSNLLAYVETTVQHNVLTVKFKDNHSYNTRKGIRIHVPVEDISKISLIGSGDIESKKTLTDKKIDVYLQGSGDIFLEVASENITAEVVGSGDLTLKGKTHHLKASVKGSGDFKGKNLTSQIAELYVNGSGDIEAYVNQKVVAEVIGSGDIEVKGSPNQVVKNIKGSGDIDVK
jgi:hypothetical protein